MRIFKVLDWKDDLKADRIVNFCENAFRIFLVLLIIYGIFRNDSINMHHGSLLYHSIMTLSMTFILGTIQKITKTTIIAEFRIFFLVFIFISQVLGEIADFYETVPWWDKMAHLASAFILTIVGYIIVYMMTEHKDPQKKINLVFASLFAYSFSLMIGVIWEVFEYFMDSAFGFNMQRSGLVDTMIDLIICVFASLVICFIYMYDIKKGKHSFVTRSITKFITKNRNGS